MASMLYQSIEALSRDKGIDPGVVVSAVEDAIALATRKYYKNTGEHARRARPKRRVRFARMSTRRLLRLRS